MLGLNFVQDSQIGDEVKRGISGGQRKRVNVGMEMVADPSVRTGNLHHPKHLHHKHLHLHPPIHHNDNIRSKSCST